VSPSANNRSTHRFDVALEIEYRHGERWHRATTRNASLGGLLIDEVELPIGQRLLVKLRLPTQKEPIEVGAVVRWQDAAGVGVQFDGLRAKDVWALGKYFETL
jgi:hypothetical protein